MVEHGAPAARPVVLFVLGMARSGTSALARVLSLCDGALPSTLAGSMPGKPHRPGQPRAANVNEKILRRYGSSGFDPTLRLQERGAFGADEKAACIDEIRGFLDTLPAAPFAIIKDPRTTLLADMWFEAARLSGFDVATVIAVRQPKEVITPGTKSTAALPELSNALWLKHNLLAEADTRDVPRVFVEHANLLADWRRELKRISGALGINLDARDEDAIEAFLEPSLHRPPAGGPPPDHFGAEWISVVYDAQSRAARDESWDQRALDQVFEAYRTSEHGYRAVFEGFQRLDKLNRHVRPSVMKMLNKARATADRRRGTAT